MLDPDWLVPAWQADGIGALMTTRAGGVSAAPFDTMNLRAGVGDDVGCVMQNQRRLSAAIGASPVYLDQVHGARVVRITAVDASSDAPVHQADASVATEPGIACTAQVADCLPVLLAAPQGRGVAAAHAGWRGLAGGVIEAALVALCDAARCEPRDVRAWLGACIGPRAFEVGRDVLDACGGRAERYVDLAPSGRPGKWFADLPMLARDRLAAAGVEQVSGGTWCTFSEPSRFFSFRRDGRTGRMVAAIWIRPGARR
ncbi:MAG: peptidoglycan editing factor PgeF [Proteobacteria bacterium]|nr:peptidoglycan editing factor PgeF [Pseudomonadota bacterium]